MRALLRGASLAVAVAITGCGGSDSSSGGEEAHRGRLVAVLP